MVILLKIYIYIEKRSILYVAFWVVDVKSPNESRKGRERCGLLFCFYPAKKSYNDIRLRTVKGLPWLT